MAEPEPVIIHNLFTIPTYAGYWMPGAWAAFMPQYGNGGRERTGLAFLNEEFAGYFTMVDNPSFMLKTPLWGEVILKESYTRGFYTCGDDGCLCRKYEKIPNHHHQFRIVSKTSDTCVAEPIITFDLSHWPVKYVLCKCGKKASIFSHSDEKYPGFHCSKCSPYIIK